MLSEANRKPLEQALGRIVVNAMADIIALPDEFRPNAEMSTEIETVDGHSWAIKIEWLDFTGPTTLSKPEATHD